VCLPRLVIVSNRVAVPDLADKGSAGGLAVALREAFQDYKGLWFGWSGRVAAQPALQPTIVDTERVQYAVIDLTQLDRQEYYNGFANRALWPTMHYRIFFAGGLYRLPAGQSDLRTRPRAVHPSRRCRMGS
jgi:trehalose 6-phosphate synthase